MRSRLLLLVSIAPLLTACTVLRTAVVKSTIRDSFDCAALMLNHMGYAIVDAEPELGILRAERSKAVTNPFHGTDAGADRIVVLVSSVRPDQVRLIARGTTLGLLPVNMVAIRTPVGFGGPPGAPMLFASAEVRADTKQVLVNCAGD